MAKINGNYEVAYILKPELGEEATAALAYPIDDLNEGYYVFMTFTADAAFPAELDRVMRITDGVMRSMIVCKDE